MRIIIPMAGKGKRMRPHTLSVPKPLIPIAGKPIVIHLVEEIIKVVKQEITEIAFVIGDFGVEVENELKQIAEKYGALAKIYYQHEPLGTAHAIYCAKDSLIGEVIIAFADTIFKADFSISSESDSMIWVKKVPNPELYGVVKVDQNNLITDFIEKPKEFVSDLAIIGIYYFKSGENLSNEIKFLIDNNIQVSGEFQLTTALENMKNKKLKFYPQSVNEWLDCGNKNATIYTNQRLLEFMNEKDLVSATSHIINSVIIKPCYISENVTIQNSVIGPDVSIGVNSIINNCVIRNSIIQQNTRLDTLILQNSMIGNFVDYKGVTNEVNIGDYTSIN